MLPLLFALALAFPTRVAPEIPVTTPVLGRVPLPQSGLRIASNGSLALAVWNDTRSWVGDVIASRVDNDGTPLDATGIVIRTNANVSDVFWNGQSFEVLSTANYSSYELTFVDIDGTVTKRIPLQIQALYAAKTDEEANTRLLFLPGSGYSPAATIADAEGRIIKTGAPDLGGSGTLAATNGPGFLVLRTSGTSERLDRDGNVLSSNNSFVAPGPWPFEALTGDGRGGFAVFARASYGIIWYSLDDRGVASGPVKVLQPKNPLEKASTPPVAVRTNDGFVVSWTISTTQNHAYTYVSRNGAPPLETYDWIGIAYSAAVDPATNLVVTAYDDAFTATSIDVFVQKGAAQPQVLTRSATLQSNAAIAPGANGFLAAWGEYSGTDARLYVRRFSAAGEPQQEPLVVEPAKLPLEAIREIPSASLASTGETYLVLWNANSARRLDARTGEWIDAAPFGFGPRPVVAIGATNSSAVAITTEPCPVQACFHASRVEMHGEPLTSPPVLIPGTDFAAQFSIASNGTDYLVAWANGVFQCPFECVPTPTPVTAIRLRADGTAIDAAPFVLDPDGRTPSVAWNGNTYLVAWTDNSTIAAANVSPEGAVQPLGTIATGESAKAVGHAGQFLIFTHTVSPNYPNPDEWRGMTLGGEPAVIVTRPNNAFGPLAAASNGGYLMLAYDRLDETSGRVGRVFLDPRVFISRRRLSR